MAITSDNVHSELNHISHQYALQEDGGLMQMNGLKVDEDPAWRLTNSRNWLHDALVERSTKWGLRFDRVNADCFGVPPAANPSQNTWAYHGTMEANVVWNCNGLMIKGNNHTITRNTVFDTSPLNFESDGQARHPRLFMRTRTSSDRYPMPMPLPMPNNPCTMPIPKQARDIAVYSWDDFGTCQCTDPFCTAQNESCCVLGDSNTYENANSVFVGNGMDGFLQLVDRKSVV